MFASEIDGTLWETDGTAAGTHALTGIAGAYGQRFLNPSDLTVYNDEVLFSGLDASEHYGLWVTDGTAAGTHELTGTGGLNPTDLTVYNGEVLFAGTNAFGDFALWVTDGTATGTHELTGIAGAYPNGLEPSDLTVYNGEVLFSGEMRAARVGVGDERDGHRHARADRHRRGVCWRALPW